MCDSPLDKSAIWNSQIGMLERWIFPALPPVGRVGLARALLFLRWLGAPVEVGVVEWGVGVFVDVADDARKLQGEDRAHLLEQLHVVFGEWGALVTEEDQRGQRFSQVGAVDAEDVGVFELLDFL